MGSLTRLVALLALSSCATALGTVSPVSASQPSPRPSVAARRACAPPQARHPSCHVLVRTVDGQPALSSPPPRSARPAAGASATPAAHPGYGPVDIQSAYNLSPTGGSGTVVAIVDAYDNPKAEPDLATFRTNYGLAACTTGNRCFRKVDQNGGTNYPSPDPTGGGWALEVDLDLDAVSSACPACHILLVEANSNDSASLFSAIDTARGLGASIISLSWSSPEDSRFDPQYNAYFQHPGVAFVAASGDSGYGPTTEFPASSPQVTAVGGTTLTTSTNPRGWDETVWSGTGSGCSGFEAKPAWQTSTLCSTRIVTDVAADADPTTGLACYDSFGGTSGLSGWGVCGGTSLGTPVIASTYALGGGEGAALGAQPFYRNTSTHDVTSGGTTGCPNPTTPLCNGAVGYDGPTGLGTPNGPPQPIPRPPAVAPVRVLASSGGPRVQFAPLDGLGPGRGASAVAVNDASIWVERNQGDGTLGAPQPLVANSPFYGSVGTAMVDLDGAGRASVIAVNSSDIWVETNQGNGTFSSPQLFASHGPFYGDVVTYMADVDGTGHASAVAVNSSSIWVERNLGNGTLGSPQPLVTSSPCYGSVGTYLADIDGSGRASLVAVNSSSVWVERNLGNGSFTAPQLAASGAFYGELVTSPADIDGSGRASLVAVNSASVWVERNQGGTFAGAQLAANNGPFYGSVGTQLVDIDGSGRASLVAVNSSNIWVESNQGSGTFGSPHVAANHGAFYGNR